MAKRFPRPVNKQESTDFSFADEYLQERKTGQWRRIQVGFPYSDDRAAGNIDYSSEEWRRSYRGQAPNPGQDINNLQVKQPESLDSAKYRYINSAKNGSNVPPGFYGTSSGIFPIDFVPFSVGDPTDNPVMVDSTFENNVTSGEAFIAKNVEYSNPLGENSYIPVDSGSLGAGRFNWEINPDYQAPVDPQVRFPMGARRRRFFK
jgi:hypothetical protein